MLMNYSENQSKGCKIVVSYHPPNTFPIAATLATVKSEGMAGQSRAFIRYKIKPITQLNIELVI